MVSVNNKKLIVVEMPNGIIHYTVPDFSRLTVDTLYNIIRQKDNEAVAANRHIRSLFDIREAGGANAYTIRKLYQVAYESPPKLNQSIAVLMHNTPKTKVLQVAFHSLPHWIMKDDLQIFFEEKPAYDWLELRQQERGD